MKATFLGIKNNKEITREEVLSEDSNIYQFEVDGEIKDFCIKESEDYYIQNHLVPSYDYFIEVENNKITNISFCNEKDACGIVEGYTPGKKTIENFLKVLLGPLGKTIYVFAGGWSFLDDKAAFMAKTIGCFPTWENFYKTIDENYSYENDTYPRNGWNRYFYAGLDCTGYLGWAIYNTMYDKNEIGDGFVYLSSTVAKRLAEQYNFGIWKRPDTDNYEEIVKLFHPGDIVSIDGHVYIILGVCSDNSVIIIHSTVTKSITGIEGGGVQLSAININGDEDTNCEAYRLIKEYMEDNYPKWIKKYPVVVKPASIYLDFSKREDLGIFSWDDTLTDFDNIRSLSGEKVLKKVLD